MKHPHWLNKLRAGLEVLPRLRQLRTRPQRSSKRRAIFEILESRLVLTVSLQPGAVPDDVVLFPAAQAGDFEIAADPIVAGDLEVVDLSVVTSDDQRHTLSLPQGSLVQVDVNERYTLSTRSLIAAQQSEGSLRFASFDVDQNLIESTTSSNTLSQSTQRLPRY